MNKIYTIFFIPIRKGSKSIKNKNIKRLNKKPLVFYTIDFCLKFNFDIIINSDSQEYINLIKKNYNTNKIKYILRPSYLGRDNTSMFNLIKKEIKKLKLLPKYLILVQPTTPFRDYKDIKKGLNLIKKYTSIIFVNKVPDIYNPSVVIYKNKMADGNKINNRTTCRQSHAMAYIPTGTYIFKVNNFKKNLYGNKTFLFEIKKTININTLKDWDDAVRFALSHTKLV